MLWGKVLSTLVLFRQSVDPSDIWPPPVRHFVEALSVGIGRMGTFVFVDTGLS